MFRVSIRPRNPSWPESDHSPGDHHSITVWPRKVPGLLSVGNIQVSFFREKYLLKGGLRDEELMLCRRPALSAVLVTDEPVVVALWEPGLQPVSHQLIITSEGRRNTPTRAS